VDTLKIAVLGGSGLKGQALAYRFAYAGHSVVLGASVIEHAAKAAEAVNSKLHGSAVVGSAECGAAVEGADVVLLAVAYRDQADVTTSVAHKLAGKIVISCINPIGSAPYRFDFVQSAAEEVARLAPGATVIGAFHHLHEQRLWDSADLLDDDDVLVCGDSLVGKMAVMELAAAITGRPGIDAGGLEHSRQLEALTAVLISINNRYLRHSGLSISGVSESGEDKSATARTAIKVIPDLVGYQTAKTNSPLLEKIHA